MYLKTLKIHGFKSFADRTRLELEPGVTIVVGPNGSGKSNIVDAISWVLGTQATKHLRTQKMEEVIFAGTANRPRHRVAEVTLTFDNDERLLPLDLAEVSITRRLHDDGTSEYEINNTPCRLLDIQEMLSDGGVGRHQHVIINQGQVATILNANPEDHRAVIEEAAGVLKHRLRRQRSGRRLEKTRTDMTRLEDILGELRKQMRPLKRQANAASRYLDMRNEAKALRLHLGGEELRTTRDRLAAAGAEKAAATATRAEAEAELNAVEEEFEELDGRSAEVRTALQRDTAAAARLETTGERLRRISQVAHERLRSITSGAEQAAERLADLRAEEAEILSELAELESTDGSLRSEIERLKAEVGALADEERSLAEQENLPAEGILAVVRGELQSLQLAGRRDEAERGRIEERLRSLDLQLADSSVEQLQQEIRTADKEAGTAQLAYEKSRSQREQAQATWERTQTEAAAVGERLAVARAYHEATTRAAVLTEETRSALEARTAPTRPVLEALDVPAELELAVVAALGPLSGGYVVDEDVAAIVGFLGAAPGRFALIDGRRGPGRASAGSVPGVTALAALLGKSSDRVLASRLLGDVVLAHDVATGWATVQSHNGLRAVTAAGDLVTADAIVLAGVDDGHAARRVSELEDETARLASLVTTSRRSFDDARERERRDLETLESVEARLSGLAHSLDRSEQARQSAIEESGRLRARQEAIVDAASQRDERVEGLRRRLADLESEEAAQQRAWEALQERRQVVRRKYEDRSSALQVAHASLAASTERGRLLKRRIEAVRQHLGGRVEGPDLADIAPRLARIEELSRLALRIVTTHVEHLRTRQAAGRIDASRLAETLAQVKARRTRLVEVIDQSRDALASLGAEIEGLRVRHEAILEGLRRDVDADEAEALAAPSVELEGGVDPHARLDELEAKLRRMGPVNPLAAEEYAGLSERAEFLEGQLADLHQSAHDLEKVIAALDQEMASLFKHAFDDIAKLFTENFAMLFPGGRGVLKLTDPDDPLNTGVEIAAQPLGKKVSRLSLLSGGERSLAALAFLFAVFRARPSPFYVLDEVEAALDDSNLHRFLRLVELLRDHAQVVIVTHQQQTMEAADTLYGITMEPGGSSQVVAKRLSEIRV